jgi:DNA-binding NarL/FixJ family response regulator
MLGESTVADADFTLLTERASPLEGLTERQREILMLLAKGYFYREIGERLGISLSTVRAHLHAIYLKLQVRTRTQAVVKFLGSD